MKIIPYKNPWPHFEVEDFLTEEQISLVRNDFISAKSPKDFGEITKDYNHTKFNFLIDNFKLLLNKINYNYDDNNTEITTFYHQLSPEANFEIHNDQESKLVSFILHISKEGKGTKLYSSKDESSFYKNARWIPRGGTIFVKTNRSWHSMDNLDSFSIRKTILINLRKK